VSVAARPFLTIEVDAEHEEDPTVAVLKALDHRDLQGTIVRLAIKVSAAGEGLLRETEISRALRDAHFVSISREVKREQRLRLGGRAAEELGPLEALALYLETKGAAQEKIQVLQDYARRLMGEDGSTMPHN
jgi:exonuclease SbcD